MSNIVTLKSFPFDSMEKLNEESGQMEDDRLYEAEIFRKYFAKFLSNGVYFGHYKNYGENSMKVSLDSGLTIKVAKGAGIIEGADYELEENSFFTLERPASGSRKDRVVVRLDKTLAERNTYLLIKEGNGTTVATLQRDDNIYEICIAEVTVKSTTNITANDIKDTRLNKSLCGIVNSLISVDGKELYTQFQGYIDAVTDNLVRKDQDSIIKGKITVNGGIVGNVKGNLEGNAKTATTASSCSGNAVTATTANTAKSCTRQRCHRYKSNNCRSMYTVIQRLQLLPRVQKSALGNSATATSASKCTGNSATATKLATARTISVSGAVSGSAKFDGSANVSIVTKQANIAVVSGTMTLEANPQSDFEKGLQQQTLKKINFPSGFNKDNCICIAFGMKIDANKNYSYGTSGSISNQAVTGAYNKHVVLGASDDVTKISVQVWQSATTKKTVYYKIVLMKIS